MRPFDAKISAHFDLTVLEWKKIKIILKSGDFFLSDAKIKSTYCQFDRLFLGASISLGKLQISVFGRSIVDNEIERVLPTSISSIVNQFATLEIKNTSSQKSKDKKSPRKNSFHFSHFKCHFDAIKTRKITNSCARNEVAKHIILI